VDIRHVTKFRSTEHTANVGAQTEEHIKPFYYQLMHIMLKNTELLKHSKIMMSTPSIIS